MRVRRWIPAVVAMALLSTVGASPTPAGPLDQRIVAVGMQYTPAELTVVQGEPLEFTNLDVASHDVVTLRNGPNGKPAFATEIIGTASTVVIEGLDQLDPGVYDFGCTLHPQMLGTLFLESAGG